MTDVADAQRVPRVVWEELRDAAVVMRLGKDDPAYGAAVRAVREHLSRARNRAELHQLLNEWGLSGSTT
jgi:hypothetical protein